MELEQLQQANEKLTARLNKAVEVFKEQKANIDSLTAQVKAAESEKENAITLFKEVDKQVGELRIENEQLKKEKPTKTSEVAKLYGLSHTLPINIAADALENYSDVILD